MRNLLFILLTVFCMPLFYASAALTVAFINGRTCESIEHNYAIIRRACVKVHGEEWLKENLIRNRRRYGAFSVYIGSNCTLEIVGINKDAQKKNKLMDLKKVFDYMALQNDTLFMDLPSDKSHIGNESDIVSWYLDLQKRFSFEYCIVNPNTYLRVGSYTNCDSESFQILHFFIANIEFVGEITPMLIEYSKVCDTGKFINLSNTSYLKKDRDRVTEEDVEFFYDFLTAHDEYILRKKRDYKVIPTGVYYIPDSTSVIKFGQIEEIP